MRVRLIRTLVVVGILAPLVAAPVRAMCMGPRLVLAPAAGTLLPENPRLYLFVPGYYGAPVVDASTPNGERPLTMTEISTGPGLTSYQIDVVVAAGTTLSVRARDPRWESMLIESDFTIAGSFPSSRTPITVRDVEMEHSSWPCSFQKTHNATLSHAAPAFRVEWTATKAASASRTKQTLVVPASMSSFFNRGGGVSPIDPVIQLGHSNCFGHTMLWSAGDTHDISITALYPDGTEQLVTSRPLMLAAPEPPWSQRFIEEYVRPQMYRLNDYIRMRIGWGFP